MSLRFKFLNHKPTNAFDSVNLYNFTLFKNSESSSPANLIEHGGQTKLRGFSEKEVHPRYRLALHYFFPSINSINQSGNSTVCSDPRLLVCSTMLRGIQIVSGVREGSSVGVFE